MGLAVFPVHAHSIFSELNLFIKYSVDQYTAQRPKVFAPRDLLLNLTFKKLETANFQLIAAGFAKDENHFIKEFESLKTNYNLVHGNRKTLHKV